LEGQDREHLRALTLGTRLKGDLRTDSNGHWGINSYPLNHQPLAYGRNIDVEARSWNIHIEEGAEYERVPVWAIGIVHRK
jgi:hypothetical protein